MRGLDITSREEEGGGEGRLGGEEEEEEWEEVEWSNLQTVSSRSK